MAQVQRVLLLEERKREKERKEEKKRGEEEKSARVKVSWFCCPLAFGWKLTSTPSPEPGGDKEPCLWSRGLFL